MLTPLVYHDRVDAAHIRIGTGSWQVWLAKTKSFRYESFWGSFTACKEHQGDDVIWIAYRQVKEEVRRAELGTGKDLTLEKLVDTAKRLSASNTAAWECTRSIKKHYETSSNKLKTIPKATETEKNAIRQWCIFYNHPDGQIEFLGACWEKEQALNRIQYLRNSAYCSESEVGIYEGTLDRYEIKEEVVMPVDYMPKRYETNRVKTESRTKEGELLNQIAKLRQQITQLQKKLEQEQILNGNNPASVKFMWN